ncbi:MAG: hypothetical protein HOO96_24000 [Polyangiaceae bacterium]|nr:hypothetical protein [Polyangiaceae bacterium]
MSTNTPAFKSSALRTAVMNVLASGLNDVNDSESLFLSFAVGAACTDLAVARVAASSPRADGADIFLMLHGAADRLELAGKLSRTTRPAIFAETVAHLRSAADVANAGVDDGFAAFIIAARLVAGFLATMSAELEGEELADAAE